MLRVSFEDELAEDGEPDTDQGRLELTVAERRIASDVTWTDQIGDRGLRSDVEGMLKALASVAKQARSDGSRAAAAKPVGRRRELD